MNHSTFLPGTGEMAELTRAYDWVNTPLGPPDAWPKSLRTILGVLLTSRHPMFLWWGPDLVQFYNDGYRPSLGGDRHPAALGARGREFWAEIWGAIGPQIDAVMTRGESTWHEDHLVPITRNRRLEEVYWTYSYSPVQDDDGSIGGTLVVVQETTGRVVGQRRLQMLRLLAAGAASSRSESQACSSILDALKSNASDLPWAAVYAASAAGTLRLIGQTQPGLDDETLATLPLREVLENGEPRLVDDLQRRVGRIVGPVWPEPVDSAWVVPIPQPGRVLPYGVVVAGVSPRLGPTADYLDFLKLAAEHASTSLTNARASEHEQRRIESLAELDRAKTAFFSNVSHEFRTPLTLMLGPTEDALASPERALGGDDLVTVYRNELRLLKLVNTLLDFARIEAGRAQATLAPTDLATLTAELASAFQSAMTRAGLRFTIDCPPLSRPVLVDREMWEKIVLNLMSNALKFTFEGSIEIALREDADTVALIVRDTGVGIPATEVPRLFERFHRVHGTQARTHEGSGIGLALVHELVKIHGGAMTVESTVGQGTTFTVTMPIADEAAAPTTAPRTHAPAPAALGAAPFVAEALRWLPADSAAAQDAAGTATASPADSAEGPILVADDNADMRDYLRRLLADRWRVETVADGAQALASIETTRPALVIADVMMPGLDGFELLRRLRARPSTADIPVLLLSARAGEEARIEGLQAGADDYVVKPFSAREFRARVEAQLLRARVRSIEAAHDRRLADLFAHAPVAIAFLGGPQHVFEFANEPYKQFVGERPFLGKPVREAFPELEGQAIFELLDRVYQSGEPFEAESLSIMLRREPDAPLEERVFKFVYQPIRRIDGSVSGVAVVATEVTELARARRDAERANRAKDEFIAMLGHELRNPLAPILTALQLLRLRGIEAAERERLVIDRQVKHLVRLVDDMLDVSRITQGKVEIARVRVDLADIVARAIEMASPLLEQRQHTLHAEVPRQQLIVEGDTERLAQVISNLLTNAAKYTEPKGRIDITGTRDGDWVVVRVRDTGIGIEPEMLPDVFDMFTQESQALDRSRGGLGLGLAIVKSLVTLHGGEVMADSGGRGTGSTFTVKLPFAAAAPPVTAGLATPAPARGRPRRVLVVDDNEDAAQMLATSLSTIGHDTRTAIDGPSALSAADTFVPDVVLIDIGLPVMDGYELARQLKKRPALQHAVLIAVTGYGQESDRRQSSHAGFSAHVVKPVDLDQLDALIASFPTDDDQPALK